MTSSVTYEYVFAVLGMPLCERAESEAEARKKVLRRWLKAISIARTTYPITPSLVLLSVDSIPATTTLDGRFDPLRAVSTALGERRSNVIRPTFDRK